MYIWPTWSFMVVLGLIAMHSVVIAGRVRRRQWGKRAEYLRKVGDDATPIDLRRAQRAERASDLYHLALRRVYYGVALISALVLMFSGGLGLPTEALKSLRMAFGALSVGCALLLITYWHGWNDDRDRPLRAAMLRAQERLMAGQGLRVRDELTGMYSKDFWLHRVELAATRGRRKSTPISCLVFEVASVQFTRRDQGDRAASELIRRIVNAASQNVRTTDLICRHGQDRFSIALFKCSPRDRDRIGQRVSRNLERFAVGHRGGRWREEKQVFWAGGTLLKDADTPIQLLSHLDFEIDQQLRQSVTPEYWEHLQPVDREQIRV